METIAPEAPDISSLGTVPGLEPVAAPQESDFSKSATEAVKPLPSPDEVEHFMQGKPPEEVAGGLQKLRAGYHDAMEPVTQDHPDESFALRANIDKDINSRIEQQKQVATQQWAQQNFQSEDEFKQFSTEYDRDPASAAQQNPQAAESLDKVLSHPAFQEHGAGPAMDLNGPDGTKYGWMQAHPDMHGGYDVHVGLSNGQGSGSFKLKGKASKADAYKAFTESKIGKKAGEFNPIRGALSETAHSVENIGAAILDKIGLGDTAKDLRQYSRQKYEGNAKTTAPGLVGDLTRLTEETAGKLPVWFLTKAGLPLEMFATAEAKGKNLADDLEAQGRKDEAKKVRDNAWLYGAASAVTGLAAGQLLSLPVKGIVKLLPETVQKAFASKISSLLGTVAAETANITSMELVQGQLVDPAFGYERAPLSDLINPGNILFGAVFGAKRYHSGSKGRGERGKLTKLADDVQSGKVTSAQQIFDAIHGKSADTKPTMEAVASGTESGLNAEPVTEGDVVKDLKIQVRRPSTAAEAAQIIQGALNARLSEMDEASRAAMKRNEAAAISRLQHLANSGGKSAEESAAILKSALEKKDQQQEPKLLGVPMTGDTVAYNGYVGRLVKDGPRLEVHTEDGKIIEVEDNDARLLTKVESTQPFDTYAYQGKSGWRYVKSNISPNGQLVSVTLAHPDGTRVKVKGDQAHKIAGLERARYLKTQIEPSTPSSSGEPTVTEAHKKTALTQLAKSLIGRLLAKGTIIVKDWQSVLAHKSMRSFSPKEMEQIKVSEGFYDPQTGKVVVILDNIRPKPGETPEQSIQRVMVHERVGHEGSRWMRENDPKFDAAWRKAVALIPKEELDSLKELYTHLSGEQDQLVGEWFARKVEGLQPGELPDPSTVFGKMWQAFKDFLARVFGNETNLDQKVRDLARDILKRPEAFEGRSGLEGDIESSVHAPGGIIAQPARKFQDDQKPKEPWAITRLLHKSVRAKHADVEEFRQANNYYDGTVAAGNMAFDALQETREGEASKLDRTKFEKDSMLGVAGSHYVEANGDVQLLKDRRDWLAANGGGQYVAPFDKAMKLTAQEKALISKSKGDFDQNIATANAAGIPLEAKENYVKHIWDLENDKNKGRPGSAEFLSRYDPDPSSFKKREHVTLFDGLKAGLTPKTMDIFKLVSINGKEVNKAISTRKLAQTVVELRNSRGMPVAIINSDQAIHLNDNAVDRLAQLAASGVAIPVQMRSYIKYGNYAVGGQKVENFHADGYTKAAGNGIKGYYFQLPPPQEDIDAARAAGGSAKLKNYYGELLFHPDVLPYINARTAPSLVKQIAARPSLGGFGMKSLIFLNREIKSSLLGALSAFHYGQEGFHGLGHLTNPLSNLPHVDPLNPEHLQWMQSGLKLGGESDAIDYLNGAYQKEAVSWKGFLDPATRKKYGGFSGSGNQLIHQIPVLGYLSNAMGRDLFTRYIPALKLKTAQNAYQRNLERFKSQLAKGSMSDAEVRHITSTAVNDAYGHINWADLGIGKSARDFMQVFMLAPDFLLARSRFAAQALGASRALGVDRSRSSREALMAFTILAAGQWALARMWNFVVNDGDMATDWKDLFTFYNKKAGWKFDVRSVPGDVLAAFAKPLEFFTNRASPVLRDIYLTANGENWQGTKVGVPAAAVDAAVGALPMTVQPFLKGSTTSGQQSSTSMREDFARAIGIKFGAYSQLEEVKRKGHEYMSTHGDKKGTDYQQPSIYKPLRTKLIDHDEEGAKVELDKLTKGDARKIESVVKGFHASLFRHYAGDAAHEVNFRREMEKTDEGRQLLKDADRQRLEAWKLFTKVGRISGELRAKYKGQIAQPNQATLEKARELRLEESRKQ